MKTAEQYFQDKYKGRQVATINAIRLMEEYGDYVKLETLEVAALEVTGSSVQDGGITYPEIIKLKDRKDLQVK